MILMHGAIAKSQWLQDESNDPSALTRIFDSDVNLAICNRVLEVKLVEFSQALCRYSKIYQTRFSGDLASIEKQLQFDLPALLGKKEFIEDVVLLVDMFSELLDLNKVGVRLAVLTKAMCPTFHVDRVPVRLITTYCGNGTEWLDNRYVKQDAKGRVEVTDNAPVKCLYAGQVGLMKGEGWEGNEGKGLAHRSCIADVASPRCVLTLDCI